MIYKLKKYFRANGIQYYQPDAAQLTFYWGITTQAGLFECVLDVQTESQRLLMLSIFPISVPEALRLDLAGILMRINYHLFLGQFELDFKDGELRFKTTLVYADAKMTLKMLESFVQSNLVAMDAYYGLLLAFLNGQISVAQVMEKYF